MELIIILVVILSVFSIICIHDSMCNHNYEDIDRFRVISPYDNAYSHTIVHCKCKKCGKYKSFKIK